MIDMIRDVLPNDPGWLVAITAILVVVFLTSRGGVGRIAALVGALFVGSLAMTAVT